MPARVRLALMVAATIALLAALAVVVFAGPDERSAASAGDGWRGSLRPAGIPAGDFRLRDQDGRTVSLHSLRGRVVILTFLYTHCEDVCPTTATTVRGALDDLGHDVPALAVSVDPAGDTPASARRFLLERHLTGDRMRFLLGSRAELEPVWRRYGIRPQGKDLDHSAYVVLLDRDGRQRIGFPVERLTSEDLAHDVRRLEQET